MTNDEAADFKLTADPYDDEEIDIKDLIQPLVHRWKVVIGASLLAGALGFASASLWPKWYTARTVMMPPQQQQSAAAAAVSQLGALAGLAGSFGNVKSPIDQYVALIQSTTVDERIIERFKLMEVYGTEFRVDAQRRLSENVGITTGKKDGLLTVEVTDRDPVRAANIANAYVDELRNVTTKLAVTEAQQRRAFFEEQMATAKERLTAAQIALGQAGLGEAVLKSEPRSVAESFARLKAEETAAVVKLQTLRRTMTEIAPEVKQQEGLLIALQDQIRKQERQTTSTSDSSEYITRFRNFKYEEALFEIFAKQYELAKVDESREGALIQVVDVATPPERKAGPRRAFITLISTGIGLVLSSVMIVGFTRFKRHQAQV